MGTSKVLEAVRRVASINSQISVVGVEKRIDGDNLPEILADVDLVIEALDSIPLKIAVERVCSERGITLVHGAIGGWIAQVAVVRPGDFILAKIYDDIQKGVESIMGNPSFTPALAASVQVSETLKVLLARGGSLDKEVLYIDLENNDFTRLDLS